MTTTANDVDPDLVIDFDHTAPLTAAEREELINDLAARKPIAFTTAHGGFWMVSGYDAVVEVLTDYDRFSSLHDGVEGDSWASRDVGLYSEDRTPRQGANIPALPARFVPTECDPPMHTDIRRLEAPFFTPKAVRGYAEMIRNHTREHINLVIESGRSELVADVISPVPVKTTREIIGFGEKGWEDFSETIHAMAMYPIASPQFPMDRFLSTRGQIDELVAKRKGEPAHDVASALTSGSVLGVEVSLDEASTILNGLTFSSTDTTASTVLHALEWLVDHPEVRDRLRNDPSLIPKAGEEFLRFFTPGLGLVRTVTRDLDFYGVRLHEGDRVMALNSAANRDPMKFEDPTRLDIDRGNAGDHIAFGIGVHKCLGAPVARLEMRILLEEILRRMPDYTLIKEQVVEYPTKGGVNGFDTMGVSFTPGEKEFA
jgi:cytochrome P450